MIQKFVDRFFEVKPDIEKALIELADFTDSLDYLSLVRTTIKALDIGVNTDVIMEYEQGSYQGTKIYIIPIESFHDDEEVYYVCVEYGSCSGCDTLSYVEYLQEPQRTKALGLMALHIVQSIKPLDIKTESWPFGIWEDE